MQSQLRKSVFIVKRENDFFYTKRLIKIVGNQVGGIYNYRHFELVLLHLNIQIHTHTQPLKIRVVKQKKGKKVENIKEQEMGNNTFLHTFTTPKLHNTRAQTHTRPLVHTRTHIHTNETFMCANGIV